MQNTKIYVGNLSYNLSEQDLVETFSDCGDIQEVKLISDRETGRSKGFAFITFDTEDSAQSALKLDGTELDSRRINVSIARPKSRTGSGARHGFDNRAQRGAYRQH